MRHAAKLYSLYKLDICMLWDLTIHFLIELIIM